MNTSEWADLDGIPDVCGYEFGDFDLDGAIGGTDLAVLFGLWGSQVRPSAISRETTPLANCSRHLISVSPLRSQVAAVTRSPSNLLALCAHGATTSIFSVRSPPILEDVWQSQLAVATRSPCKGLVSCAWGSDINGPCAIPFDLGRCIAIAGGSNHTIAIQTDNSNLDGDGVLIEQDNCPSVFNPSQTDCNGNGHGDACEPFADCNANSIPDSCDIASG